MEKVTKKEQRQISRLKVLKMINSHDEIAVKSIDKQISNLQQN